MRTDAFGAERDPDLLWVMGWGNTVESRHERWFVDRLVDAGYRVHAVQLPTNVADVGAGWVEPVEAYRADLDEHVAVGHSAGGLTATFLDVGTRRVLLSPWWGFAADTSTVLGLLARLPTGARILPTGVDPALLGELATEADVTSPDRASPAFVRAVRRAHGRLPPLDAADVVFASLRDEVVSVRAIGRHADPAQVELYDGGHELFASGGRDEAVERVIDAIDAGY